MRGHFRAGLTGTSFVATLAFIACTSASPPQGGLLVFSTRGQSERTTALAVDSALAAIAARPPWPGFEPLRTPVAIYDGARTWLFRHPQPPAGYVAVFNRPGVVVRDGRDPAVSANTSAQLGGVATATMMLDARRSTTEMAALTVHELFHVFQRARHPSWQANEADLFTYPVEDSAALALRREETFVLSRALRADRADSVRCWTLAFLDARRRRFALVGSTAAAYERGTELNEGLAQYVERRAASERVTLDSADVPAALVRQRAYAVGAALAAALDRAQPEWREVLERSADTATRPLDLLLADAVGPASSASPTACSPEALWAAWAAPAGSDVRALVAERRRAREEFLGRGGWRIVVDVADDPFFPQGFDPLNVLRLSPTEILHTRFLKLQGGVGAVEVLGASVLTEGASGAHPLFNGVRRVTITGLSTPPSMADSAGVMIIAAPGFTARLHGVRLGVTGDTVRVTPL